MKTRTLCLATFIVFCAFASFGGQIDTSPVPEMQDTRNLFSRASTSRYVVIGSVLKSEGVTKRLIPELIKKVEDEGNLSLTVGGSLLTIRVESTVCREQDFKISGATTGTPVRVLVFVPRDEPMFTRGNQREALLPGRKYLLFLTNVSPEAREAWIKKYQLDSGVEYFRGQDLSRGVILLPEKEGDRNKVPVLEKVSRLCAAVKPQPLARKLAALKILEDSDDPVLKEEAGLAKKFLQAQLSPIK